MRGGQGKRGSHLAFGCAAGISSEPCCRFPVGRGEETTEQERDPVLRSLDAGG